MSVPDFDKFLASLNVEEYEQKIAELNINGTIEVSDIQDPRNINALIAHLFQESVIAASNVSLLNLQAYHEWLQKYLD